MLILHHLIRAPVDMGQSPLPPKGHSNKKCAVVNLGFIYFDINVIWNPKSEVHLFMGSTWNFHDDKPTLTINMYSSLWIHDQMSLVLQ